jgi:maleylpyruvate isomerase
MVADTDNTTDPAITAALLLVRRGTEYFSHTLDELPDSEFKGPSLLPDWTRSHVIAHLAYNALAIARLAEWAATGIEHPMYESREVREREVEHGVALSPQELRSFSEQVNARLDERWRTLPKDAWGAEVRTLSGLLVPASKTLWMRTREVWLHAVDLDSGASFADFPAEFLDHLLADVLSTWRGRQEAEGIPNFVLEPSDGHESRRISHADSEPRIVLRGTAAALASWATGRGSAGVETESGQPVPPAPTWL